MRRIASYPFREDRVSMPIFAEAPKEWPFAGTDSARTIRTTPRPSWRAIPPPPNHRVRRRPPPGSGGAGRSDPAFPPPRSKALKSSNYYCSHHRRRRITGPRATSPRSPPPPSFPSLSNAKRCALKGTVDDTLSNLTGYPWTCFLISMRPDGHVDPTPSVR